MWNIRQNFPILFKRNFHNADYIFINDVISSIDWHHELQDRDVDSQVAILNTFLSSITDTFIPVCKAPSRLRPPWFNSELRYLVNKKKRAHQTLRNFTTPSNLAAFKKAREKATQSIRQSRISYESSIVLRSQHNPKVLFSYINKNKKTVPASCLKNQDDSVTTDDSEIAAKFNNYFSGVFHSTSVSPPSPVSGGSPTFTEADIHEALKNIKTDTSPGPDGLSPLLLKNCASSLALPVHIIFKTSLTSCVFPRIWKDAHITPVFKDGSPQCVSNYRPISLLSILSKILENFVHKDIYHQCTSLGIIPDSQHGFIPGRSCNTNLLSTYDEITRSLDAGIPCDMVFFDFRKAFDTVSHTKLIDKLTSFGLKKTTIHWIHSYLYSRRQRVVLRGNFAPWAHVTSGVPQGSVLGPLLFNIFISDLSKGLHCSHCSYADDLKIFSSSVLHTNLQHDINFVSTWCQKNSLTLNPDKCVVIHFGNNNPAIPYTINSVVIPVKSPHRDLGILIDSSLKFHLHAEQVISRIFRKAHYILKSFVKLSASLFSILYKSFLRPVFDFCAQVCRPCYSYPIDRLESCQRRLTKWCYPIRHLSYSERLASLNLTTVRKRLLRGDLIFTYQILRNLLNINSNDFFFPAPIHTRGHTFKIQGFTSRTNIRHRFFTERVINQWNALPEAVVSAPSLNSFKARLDSHMC